MHIVKFLYKDVFGERLKGIKKKLFLKLENILLMNKNKVF